MKKISAIVLFLLVTIISFAQKPLEYTKEFNVDNKSKEDLFKIVEPFFVVSYDSYKEVASTPDSIVVEGYTSFPFMTDVVYSSIEGKISYTGKMIIKNGSVKFSNINFTHQSEKKAAFDNNMGLLYDPLPKDLSTIGVKGLTRKACYKYYYKHGVILCKQKYENQLDKLMNFLFK